MFEQQNMSFASVHASGSVHAQEEQSECMPRNTSDFFKLTNFVLTKYRKNTSHTWWESGCALSNIQTPLFMEQVYNNTV